MKASSEAHSLNHAACQSFSALAAAAAMAALRRRGLPGYVVFFASGLLLRNLN